MLKLINAPLLRGGLPTKLLSQEQSEILIRLMLKESDNQPIFNLEHLERELDPNGDADGALFFLKAIQKRIDVMKLPIRFTGTALLSILAFVDRIGGAIILLIDTLEYLSKENDLVLVTLDDLVGLYPSGFYDIDSTEVQEWINTKIKAGNPERIKWADVYERE